MVDPGTVGSSLYIREAQRTDKHEVRKIQVVTLDSIVERRGAPQILKIDAEAAELEILQSGTSVFGQTELILRTRSRRRQGARQVRHVVHQHANRPHGPQLGKVAITM